jgi:uncharacterized glyoxalase superfamily protein PhnB
MPTLVAIDSRSGQMSSDERGGHQVVYPFLRYADARAAIDWLVAAFGFKKHAVYEDDSGGIAHAQLTFGGGMIFVSSVRGEARTHTPGDLAYDGGLSIYVEDPDGHFARAKAAGADIIYEPVDQDYGSREYGCRDLEGNLWSFGTFHP